MAKTAEKPQQKELTSAEIIRELRGPLPEDDPEYQRFMASGGERERKSSPQEQEAYEAVMKELRFSEHLTPARVVELLQMLPPSGATQSSADIIRELRGPLPGDEE